MTFKPPQNISKRDKSKASFFLAGSIEMGKAEDWHKEIGSFLLGLGFAVFNPRRDDWDGTWEQKFDNPQFHQQVSWELNALDRADHVVFYFSPGTQSPISLLELGLYAGSGKAFVVCPEGFWRKGNVEVVCEKYDIRLFDSLLEFKNHMSALSWSVRN
jgi:hypothetical protein